jgi:hypothetical protein
MCIRWELDWLVGERGALPRSVPGARLYAYGHGHYATLARTGRGADRNKNVSDAEFRDSPILRPVRATARINHGPSEVDCIINITHLIYDRCRGWSRAEHPTS